MRCSAFWAGPPCLHGSETAIDVTAGWRQAKQPVPPKKQTARSRSIWQESESAWILISAGTSHSKLRLLREPNFILQGWSILFRQAPKRSHKQNKTNHYSVVNCPGKKHPLDNLIKHSNRFVQEHTFATN